jgi:hypothetical protein
MPLRSPFLQLTMSVLIAAIYIGAARRLTVRERAGCSKAAK